MKVATMSMFLLLGKSISALGGNSLLGRDLAKLYASDNFRTKTGQLLRCGHGGGTTYGSDFRQYSQLLFHLERILLFGKIYRGYSVMW